jgi:hypothetical protein
MSRNKRPVSEMGSLVAEASDADDINFFGGSFSEGVAFTKSQVKILTDFYGTENTQPSSIKKNPYTGKEEDIADLGEAFSWRATAREASTDGLRIMAFLAKHELLENGEDPVRSLAHAIRPDFFRGTPDIWGEDDG